MMNPREAFEPPSVGFYSIGFLSLVVNGYFFCKFENSFQILTLARTGVYTRLMQDCPRLGRR